MTEQENKNSDGRWPFFPGPWWVLLLSRAMRHREAAFPHCSTSLSALQVISHFPQSRRSQKVWLAGLKRGEVCLQGP